LNDGFLSNKFDRAHVTLSFDEVCVIAQALNEVCNGIELFEFETRMGADEDYVSNLLKEFVCLRNEIKNI